MRANHPALAAAGLSGSVFLIEVLLTRVFSVTLFHHFAFAAISLGMLGLASGAQRVALGGSRFTEERGADDVVESAALLALTGAIAALVIVQLGVFPAFSWTAVWTLALIYVCCFVPFYFAGLALSLVFTHGRRNFAALYASDLVAAGVAGVAVFPLLGWLGGPAALVGATVLGPLGALAAFPSARRGARLRAWGAVAFALVVILADAPLGVLHLQRPKGARTQKVLFEKWNGISRIAVYDTPLWPWSLSPLYRGAVPKSLRLDIDAAAATPIVAAGLVPRMNDYLRHELTSAAHVVAPKGRALVIGAGGGRDVLAALLAGTKVVDAVEINPIIVNDVMRTRFRAVSGGLYDDPRVHVTVADGRSFVRGSSLPYDLIQLSLVDTWAATAAGAFALSENNLYTLEAVQEYINHLTEDGVLTLTRWAGGETYRMVVLVSAAARGLGVKDAGRHLAVVSYPDATGSRNVPVVLLYRRSEFDPQSIAELRSFVDAEGFAWLHDPLRVVEGRLSEIARADEPLAEAERTEGYDLSPPTDDRPFFFYRPGPFVKGLLDDPTRLFTEGRYLVSGVLLLASTMGVAFILLPLWRAGRRALEVAPAAAVQAAPYFAGIGLGFMLVEVSLMQRFVLFLGHPTPALTAVVAGLLAGAGAGSGAVAVLSRRRSISASWMCALAILALVAMDLAGRGLLSSSLSRSLLEKVLLTEALLLPLGAALGTVMPAGMRGLAEEAPGLVPWAWGVNGFASVVGACLGALVSMANGFSFTFHLGVVCYGIACLAALPGSRSRATAAAGVVP